MCRACTCDSVRGTSISKLQDTCSSGRTHCQLQRLSMLLLLVATAPMIAGTSGVNKDTSFLVQPLGPAVQKWVVSQDIPDVQVLARIMPGEQAAETSKVQEQNVDVAKNRARCNPRSAGYCCRVPQSAPQRRLLWSKTMLDRLTSPTQRPATVGLEPRSAGSNGRRHFSSAHRDQRSPGYWVENIVPAPTVTYTAQATVVKKFAPAPFVTCAG